MRLKKNPPKTCNVTWSDITILGAYINEDGELALAYETQKTINKQLELELQDEKAKYKAHEREYKLEIERLREDNERQQRLLSANLNESPLTQSEAFMQHEIARLTADNLTLFDRNETLTEEVRRLKRQVSNLTPSTPSGGVIGRARKTRHPDLDRSRTRQPIGFYEFLTYLVK